MESNRIADQLAPAMDAHVDKSYGHSAQNGSAPKELDLLCAAHDIVIPPIPCSFSWSCHPDLKALREISDAWVLEHFSKLPGADGRRSYFKTEHLIESAFYLITALTSPSGMSERMPPIVKMMAWIFMVDNVLDDPKEMGMDATGVEEVVESLLTVFRDTYAHHCPNPNPVVRVLTDTAAEWWAEVSQDMPPNQKARLSQALCDFLHSNQVQVPYRNSRQLPDLETYLQFRESSIGWAPFAVIIEHSQGFELDDESSSHPLLLELHKNVNHHIILSNDITSFKKEYMQGDFCNVVALLYFQKLYDPNRNPDGRAPTLQGAILEAVEMVRETNQNCVTVMEQIRECNELKSKPYMEKYLQGVGHWISGNLYWHLGSARYGICGSSNIHEIAPNMHVDHQLKIDVNKAAAKTVPKQVMTSI